MPTLCWSSPLLKSTTDGLSLAVETAHQLKLAIDDEPILKIQKFPPPGSLDILSTSSILMRLAGSFGAKQVSAETLRRSSLASYLLEYLKFHSAQLFIGSISGPYLNADGVLELAIASSRPLLDPAELPVTTATLIAINWTFTWKSNSTEDSCVNPFSSQHLLPVQTMVSSVTERVISRDFVRRYPLIFGSWRNSLSAEIDMFPQLAQPVLNIISRSQNTAFQKQCRKLLRSLRRSNDVVYDNSQGRLQDTLGPLPLDDVLAFPNRDDEKVLLISLQRLHRTLFRAERFKTSTFITKSDVSPHDSDHFAPPPDTLLECGDSEPFEGLDNPPADFDETSFVDLLTESESSQGTTNMDVLPVISTHMDLLATADIPMVRIKQFETPPLKETASVVFLPERDADDFIILAGLNDDWEPIDLRPGPSIWPERSFFELDCMPLDLDASSTGFLHHMGDNSEFPRYRGLGAVLDHPVLDLDSEDNGEIGEEEMVLDF